MKTVAPSSQSAVIPYQRIAFGVDCDSLPQQAALYVARLTAGTQAAVRVVTVVANPRALLPAASSAMVDWAAVHDELCKAAQAMLDEIRKVLAQSGLEAETELVDLAQTGGRIPDALEAAVDAWKADLLVVGSHRRHGIDRWLMGSTAVPVVRRSNRPVLLLPEHTSEHRQVPPRRIMVAIDGSATSQQALREALRLAGPHSEFHAVHMVDRAVRLSHILPIDALYRQFGEHDERAVAEARKALTEHRCRGDAIILETHRVSDDVPHALVRACDEWQADLLVMGTHGQRRAAKWFLGSVAERVARLAPLPLMLVRHREPLA
jgi:nucleotide-binding universal stress UspA family protein